MRVEITNGLGWFELIDQREPDWKYAPLCAEAEEIATLALAEDPDPDAPEIRTMLAATSFGIALPNQSDDELLWALEGALRLGIVRATSWRTAAPEHLAPYLPPPPPPAASQPPPRAAPPAPRQPPPPEEATVADAQCLEDAANMGTPLVHQS